jgi:hypothetical protein
MPHAEINGIQVYYEVHGNGPNMALIEGWGTTAGCGTGKCLPSPTTFAS